MLILNLLITAFSIVIFLLLNKKFSVFSTGTSFCVVIFILLSLFAGRTLDLYSRIPFWDKILHFLSGFLFAQAGKEIYLRWGGAEKNKTLVILFSLFSAFSAAGLWEIWEFAGDKLLGTTSQNASLDDTMYDIIWGSMSAITKVFVLDRILKNIKKTGKV